MNDSNSKPNEFAPADAQSRFVDAALHELANGEGAAAFPDRVEQALDEVDLENGVEKADAKRRYLPWVGGGLAAALTIGTVFHFSTSTSTFDESQSDRILLAELSQKMVYEDVPRDQLQSSSADATEEEMIRSERPTTSPTPEPTENAPAKELVAVHREATPFSTSVAESRPEKRENDAVPAPAPAPHPAKPAKPAAQAAPLVAQINAKPGASPAPMPTPGPAAAPAPKPRPDGVSETDAPKSSAGDTLFGISAGNRATSTKSPQPVAAPASTSSAPVDTYRSSTTVTSTGMVGRDKNLAGRNATLGGSGSLGVGGSFGYNEASISRGTPRGERESRISSGERYGELIDNRFLSPLDEPLSTFSVDVDTASYTNLRRMISSGSGIPRDSVRIEEMINYFSYDYPQPKGKHPFAFALETAACPWNAQHQLLRVGIQGKEMNRDQRPDANLVFLLDVSGSMNSDDKLPLVKESMSLLIEELTADDCVSIVVYAGAEGLALPPTKGSEHAKILRSLDRLKSGGSTNGGAGIQLAYQMAAENYVEDGINRVILCTDGDFNVGKTRDGDLVKLVERKAKSGVFLSVLGFGTGNINDSMMEAITNQGNGTYYYIDSLREARKVFLQDLMSTLVTIAKDVKIQIEFNPAQVQSYRLIGYANRMLEAEDFENDKVDAGEVGAGHAVTALYEIVPTGVEMKAGGSVPALKYQREKPRDIEVVDNGELATLKLRYKQPDSDTSVPMEAPVVTNSRQWQKASNDFQFAAAVALFGMELRGGEYAGEGTLKDVLEMAKEGLGADPFGRRTEFIEMVKAIRNR